MIKRFTEIVSTQKVIDNLTGNEYHCLIDDDLLKLLNELHEDNQMLDRLIEKRDGWNNLAHERIFQLEKENKQLKKAIVETEKMVQSTYDELTKLRCFKKNISRIKHSWDYLMEAIQYD